MIMSNRRRNGSSPFVSFERVWWSLSMGGERRGGDDVDVVIRAGVVAG